MDRVARFDDLVSGASFEFEGLHRIITAEHVDDVRPALADVEGAVAGGAWAAGYLAYEAAPGIDPRLSVRRREPDGIPLVWFGIYANRAPAPSLAARTTRPAPYTVSAWSPSIDRAAYDAAFAEIRGHIGAGDTHQVNHTFRLHSAFAGEEFELYRDLALSQRGSYSAFLDLGRYVIASASPELFFRRDREVLTTRPMKGTVARGRWAAEDDAYAAQLVASKKDQAENLMIVDLLRNDMGRVADVGTVRVQRLFELERYETVWQLTSTITATVGDAVGFADVMGALFPCGSVTGSPKQRTMELIAGLEDSPRGVYCGTIGFLAPADAPGPSACFSVAIRTVTVDRDEGLAEFGVGGAITCDSSPIGEYDEARAKAQVLVQRRPDFELLETIRFEPGEGFSWLKEHLGRLEATARYFGFAYDEATVRDALDRAAAGAPAGPCRVRLTMSRSGGCRATADALATRTETVVVTLDDEPISSQNVFLFHKTTYRREYDLRRARHPEADDVILVNERGEITETTAGNLAVLLDGVWVTPPLDSGLLPGVYRQVLLEAGRIFEGAVTVGALARAEGLAVFNSVRLWREARLSGLTERGAPQTVG